jgi:hypothetical protein
LKLMVKEKLGDEDAPMAEHSTGACRTFVTTTLHPDGSQIVLRSYECKDTKTKPCFIWQAARATTAITAFFKPTFVDTPFPGSWFISAEPKYANPTEIALEEARRLYPTAKKYCFVSIGTGRSSPVRSKSARSAHFHDDDGWEKTLAWESARTTLKGLGTGQSRFDKIKETCHDIAMSSEHVDQRIRHVAKSHDRDVAFAYYRFNLITNIEDAGWKEWDILQEMAEEAGSYTSLANVRVKVNRCILHLLEPREIERLFLMLYLLSYRCRCSSEGGHGFYGPLS